MNTPLQSEASIQSQCFRWHWNTYPAQRGRLFMVYNNPKNAAHGAILKGMGMVKGVSDLIYLPASQSSPLYALNPSGNVEASPVLFLECKIEGEYQKSEQIEFEKLVRELGHEYYVFRSLGEFQEILKPYL